MRSKSLIAAAGAALAIAAPAGADSGKYTPFVTDFPAATAVKTPFIPGVTDFPRPSTGYRVIAEKPTTVAAPSDGGIEWIDASVGAAVGAALGLGLLGSALLVRRRVTVAH